MLILERRVGKAVKIGDDITVYVLEAKGGNLRIGIEAQPDVVIIREELLPEPPVDHCQ